MVAVFLIIDVYLYTEYFEMFKALFTAQVAITTPYDHGMITSCWV